MSDVYFNQKQTIFKKVQKTLMEIFENRRYTLSPVIPADFQTDGQSTVLSGIDTNGVETIVFLVLSKIGKEKVLKIINENETSHVIIVSETSITSKGKQVMEGYNVETFLVQEVIFNILKHVLQPKFELLAQEDIANLLGHLHCNLNDFPKIKVNDPVSLYYRATPKQVFKITRKNGVYYRLVVAS
jgi:DNA-directed RNA polymerase subunit H (RpoH/RPB5)